MAKVKYSDYHKLAHELRAIEDTNLLVDFFNELCYRTDNISKLISPMKDLDCEELGNLELLYSAYYGDFKVIDTWFYRDENGYLYSFTNKDEKNFRRWVDPKISEIARYIVDNIDYENKNIIEIATEFITD